MPKGAPASSLLGYWEIQNGLGLLARLTARRCLRHSFGHQASIAQQERHPLDDLEAERRKQMEGTMSMKESACAFRQGLERLGAWMESSMPMRVGLAALSLAALFLLAAVAASDDCDVDDCIVVTAPRDTCTEGWSCTDSLPSGIDCWRELTSMHHARMSDTFDEHLARGSDGGIDIAVPDGTPVYAAKNGRVAGFMDKYKKGDKTAPLNGNFIRINYDDGTQGVFIHLQSVENDLEVVGARVYARELVGFSNSTGGARGAHLHYSQYSEGRQVDPMLEHDGCP